MSLDVERVGEVLVVTIDRPERRNAVDAATAESLYGVFVEFESDAETKAAVLTGAGGTFCAGADLKAIAEGRPNRVDPDVAQPGPMGCTRLTLSKPVIAAVEGHAVAGGLELALWCDLRVAARDAVFGVFCRRWGVPLVDGGTVRLPRLIGLSRAMDMILTGRPVDAVEAFEWGLVNRLAESGRALEVALDLATSLCRLPQNCLRSDRRSALEAWGLSEKEALANETRLGLETIRTGETLEGARRFSEGQGRHGAPV
ncbi:MAG: enoyl-CoA hydratase [Acidimicrobiales bacterium]|nr:MAG: enoyl-CoA hydratase [Acidimicrobiales bacterium]